MLGKVSALLFAASTPRRGQAARILKKTGLRNFEKRTAAESLEKRTHIILVCLKIGYIPNEIAI